VTMLILTEKKEKEKKKKKTRGRSLKTPPTTYVTPRLSCGLGKTLNSAIPKVKQQSAGRKAGAVAVLRRNEANFSLVRS